LTLLENQHVQCSGAASVVTGPATLAFDGNGGFELGARFSITLSAFSASSAASCLDFSLWFPHVTGPRSEVHARVCPSGAITSGYVGGFISQWPVIQAHVSPAGGAAVLTLVASETSWEVIGDGDSLVYEPYPSSDYSPVSLNEVRVQVDSGARVTISAFTIRPSAG
jgi:hypothetical protein